MSTFLELVIAVELAVIAIGVWCYPVPVIHEKITSFPVLPKTSTWPRQPTKEELDHFLDEMRTTYPHD